MDYDTLLKNFDLMNERIKEAQQEMGKMSKGLIEGAVQRFLDQCPEVTGVHWTQYTPYFNDGDSCEFSVNDFCFHILENEDDEIEPYDSNIIHTQADLDAAIARMKEVEEYLSDPFAWRQKKIREYKAEFNSPPPTWYTTESFKPYPNTVERAQELIDGIKQSFEKIDAVTAQRIRDSFKEFKTAMEKIPDNIMESIYGDHVLVVINRNGTEIDEYDHA